MVLSAVMLAMLSIIAALCMNAAYVELAKSEMRLATDASAKAASIILGLTGDETQAQTRAKQVCQKHYVAGERLQIRNVDVDFGRAIMNNNGTYTFVENQTPKNAVKVHASFVRRAGGTAALPALGQFLGREDFTLSQDSIAARIDNDICLVVDRSGSMAWDTTGEPYSYPGDLHGKSHIQNYFLPPHATGSRWAALNTSVNMFLDILEQNPRQPRVSLVSYSSNFAFGQFESTVSSIDQPLTANFSAIRASMTFIGSKPVMGNTNIAAGLRDGINTLAAEATSRPNSAHNVVLFTDGVMTQGDDPVALAALALTQNIKVHTITFGEETALVGEDGLSGRERMAAVAAAGGGTYYHAPDAATLNAIFAELAETLPAMLIQ